MKALAYASLGKIMLKDGPEPEITAPGDAVVRVTHTTSSTDLHILKDDKMKQILGAIRSKQNLLRLDWMKEAVLGLFSPRMSVVAFHLDYFIFPPVIIFCLAASIRLLNATFIAVLFFGGLVAWSLAEYLLHRFVLHHWPYFSGHHKAHHDSPRSMIGAPTLFTLAFFAAVFCLPLWLLDGEAIALSSFAGFLTGYVAYGAIHHAVHHAEGQGLLLRHFKRLHAIHHHGSCDRNFGVLTSFWDRVFGTYSGRVTRR